MKFFKGEKGAIGYILLWLLGVPASGIICDLSVTRLHVAETRAKRKRDQRLDHISVCNANGSEVFDGSH